MRSPNDERRHLWWWIGIAWVIAIAMVTLLVFVFWLVLGTPGLEQPRTLAPGGLDALATRAFASVAGLGGVALLVIAYRRQRTTERGEQREVAKLFTDTFDSASSKLGSEHAPVRLAGVHALARLADEAPEGREDLVQMVIDVLCAYLRMPYDYFPEPLPKDAGSERREEHRKCELEFFAMREVRHTIIRIIGSHLREDTRWRGKDFDFTGVVFDGGNLTGAVFSGGRVDFRGAVFSGGRVDFSRSTFSGGRIDFTEAIFSSGMVVFAGAKFSGGAVDFSSATFSGSEVIFAGAEFSGGWVNLRGARFTSGIANFSRAVFSGSWVTFLSANFSGSQVVFAGAAFSGGRVTFSRAAFSGSKVVFVHAEFSDGVVSFADTRFSSGRVNFRRGGPNAGARGACPEGLLEARTAGQANVVLLPDAWETTSDQHDGQEGPDASDDSASSSGEP